MDFFEVIEGRHSVRAFRAQDVETHKLEQLLQSANRAPSAGNLQAYEIVVVKRQEQKRSLAEAAGGQDYVAEAPAVLVFCANPARSAPKYQKRGERLYSVQDATIACTFAMLAATAVGLATVWVGAFDDQAVGAALGLPKGWLPVAVLPVGYPAQPAQPSPRRGLSDLVHEM